MRTVEQTEVQPGALMAHAPASLTAAQLNATLAPYGLWLPICPLVANRTLADLVAYNSGGRYRLAHGPIGRYLRAASLESGVTLGGPTIKRATGYGLHRAIAGDGPSFGAPHAFTFSLHPLPAARSYTLLHCANPLATCQLAESLLQRGVALRALALAEEVDGDGLLLAEIAGLPAVVARQTADLHATAQAAGAVPTVAHASAWARWEALAASQRTADLALELTLPRAALPAYIAAAHASARRHGRSLALWGDAGLGALYLQLDGPADPAGRRCLAILASLAQAVGGDLSSELGRPEAQGHTTGSPPHAAADKTMPPATRRQPIPPQSALPALRAAVGQRWLLTRPDELATYTLDASIAQPSGLPLAVALPANIAELVDLMQIAAAHGLPVVGRGAGSGLAGGATPSASALVIGLSRMNRITIDRRQRVAHVGAGSITADLQRAATAARLFYPPDPSSQSVSTIGGNIACNAGGPRCVKYGVTADYVLGLTAVLADGSLVRWGDGLTGQGPTSSLCQLLVGSEGSLAIIAEATLRLLAQPASQHTTMAIFPTLEAACSAVEQIMAAGIVPAGLELMDDTTMAAVEAYLQIGLPRAAGAMLLMFADGEPEAVATEAQAMADLAWRNGALQVQAARNPAEEALLWRGRRAIAPALARIRPSRLGEDISVPLPQIAAFVRRVSQISAAHRLPIAVFGHAGDGNLHPNILFDPRDPSEQARLWPCAEAIVGAALDLGGTLSGEHGVGTLKRAFLPQALGGEALALQRRIKARLDPQGRLNPGKIFPDLP